MNFLQLVQFTKREAGISGAVPTTLVSQVEEINRVAQWVNSAWLDIQQQHPDAEWMRQSFSFNTTVNQGTYTPAQAGITSFTDWKRDSMRKYLVSGGVSGMMFLPYMDYDTFRNMYLYGTMSQTYGPPVVWSPTPAKSLSLGNAPDGIYNISGEYYAAPTTLALDADTPSMPAQWHTAICWKALAHYGMYEAANEAVTRGEKEYNRMLARIQADQMPVVSFGPPLA